MNGDGPPLLWRGKLWEKGAGGVGMLIGCMDTSQRGEKATRPCWRQHGCREGLLSLWHFLFASTPLTVVVLSAPCGRPMILISSTFGAVGTASVVGFLFTNAVMCRLIHRIEPIRLHSEMLSVLMRCHKKPNKLTSVWFCIPVH